MFAAYSSLLALLLSVLHISALTIPEVKASISKSVNTTTSEPRAPRPILHMTNATFHEFVTNGTISTIHDFYLPDVKIFVSGLTTAGAAVSSKPLSKRQSYSYQFTNTKVDGGSWLGTGAYNPVSNCLRTGLDPEGGSLALTYSFTISEEYQAGIDISGAFGLATSLDYSITQSWSTSGTYTCNVAGNSVVQLWFQGDYVNHEFLQQTCTAFVYQYGVMTTSCGAWSGDLWAAFPNYQGTYGCSTGDAYVSC